MSKIKDQILEFVTRQETQAQTFKNGKIDVRLRIKNIYLEGQSPAIKGVVIADIVLAPELRGKGIFTAMLKDIEAVTPHKLLYVECIGNQRLATHLAAAGWTRESAADVNYYKIINND